MAIAALWICFSLVIFWIRFGASIINPGVEEGMLIDTYLLRNTSLEEYPNRLVVAVKVRSWELNPGEFPWGASAIHGEEGVWHQVEGLFREDVPDGIVRLEPMAQEEPYRVLFDLRPVFHEKPRRHVLHRQRWLVRYWDADVYIPTIQSVQVTASGSMQEDGSFLWSVAWGQISVSGLTLDHEHPVLE